MVPFSSLIEEILELTAPDAEHFGCTEEVGHARKIVERGTSADRQVARFNAAKAEGASEEEALRAVVDE